MVSDWQPRLKNALFFLVIKFVAPVLKTFYLVFMMKTGSRYRPDRCQSVKPTEKSVIYCFRSVFCKTKIKT